MLKESFTGTVTNLAARLCGEARPGQILISQRLLATVEELVETEPVGELQLPPRGDRPQRPPAERVVRAATPADQ